MTLRRFFEFLAGLLFGLGLMLAGIQDILNRRVLDLPTLAELAALPALSPNWRALFEKRARLGQVEDWQRRLQGDPADASTGTPST